MGIFFLIKSYQNSFLFDLLQRVNGIVKENLHEASKYPNGIPNS